MVNTLGAYDVKCFCGCGETIPPSRVKHALECKKLPKWFSSKCYYRYTNRQVNKVVKPFNYEKYTFDQILDAFLKPARVKAK
jgi:hypothetical protein